MALGKTAYWNIDAARPSLVDDLEARILYEEDGIVVVDKPGGIQTSGKTLEDSNCLQFWMMKRARKMVWAVHQLDADTSGINIFVRKKSLVPEYQKRMLFPNAQKTYFALAHGNPEWQKKLVDAPIGQLEPGKLGVTTKGRSAKTDFEVLSRGDAYCWIAATLRSGRTHQIRIHLQHIGLYLVGEPWYCAQSCDIHHRHALHATEITFRDRAKPQSLFCSLPDDLLKLSSELGLLAPKLS